MKTFLIYIEVIALMAIVTSCSEEWDGQSSSHDRTLQIQVTDAIISENRDGAVRSAKADSIDFDGRPQNRMDIGDDWAISTYVSNLHSSFTTKAEEVVTRGTPIHTATKLPTIGMAIYNSEINNLSNTTSLWQRVQAVNQNNTGSWSIPGEAILWPKDDYKLSFLSFSPYPTTASGLTWASDGRTLDYTVPTAVANQPDLCLGNPITNRTNLAGSGNHVITIALQHALTAIGIKASASKVKIVSATIKNIKTKGTLNLNPNPNIDKPVEWSDVTTTGNRVIAVSETVESVDMKDITNTNGYLMMIPQTPDDAAILELIFDDLSATPVKRVTKTVRLNTLTPKQWEAGKLIFYNLQMKTQFSLTLNPMEINLESEAGSYSTGISYTSNNPNPPIASANQGWISNIQVNPTTGKITFDYSENKGKNERTAVITVTSGLTTKTVNVKQSPKRIIPEEANCYLVQPSGPTISFSVNVVNKRINSTNGTVETYNGIGENDVFTTELLWQTTKAAIGKPGSCISSIKAVGIGSKGKIEVTPGAVAGSALVALKVNGKIRWAWHIWVTTYDPEKNYKSFNGKIWMDRNLGAQSSNPGSIDAIGMMFQWGRRDPLTGMMSFSSYVERPIYDATGQSVKITNQQVYTAENFETALENPMVCYPLTSGNGSWEGREAYNNYLWNEQKTIFDPCPPGWQVPKLEDFGNLTNFKYNRWQDYGRIHANLGYFPFTGNRSFQYGTFGNIGQMGFCWTTSQGDRSEVRSIKFLLYDKKQAIVFDDNRISGCPLRCVKKNN